MGKNFALGFQQPGVLRARIATRLMICAGLMGLGILAPAAGRAEEFFTLKGHGGPIMSVAAAQDAIATASFDNSVGLWRDHRPIWLEGHEAAVNDVIFLPGGRLASGGDDFAVILWTPDGDGYSGVRLEGHQGKVMGLAVAPDGDLLASASWDGTIGLWPLDGGAPRFLKGHRSGVNDVVFSVDGRRLYSASSDGTIGVWDVARGDQTGVLARHGFGVNRLARAPEGQWLAYGAVDGVTRILSLETGAYQTGTGQTGTEIAEFTRDRRPILALSAAPDGTQLAVGDGEGFIMVIDTARWQIRRDFRATARGPVWALAFSRDGTSIYAGGLDDAMFGWPVDTLDEHEQMTTGPRSFLRDPATMPNGERQFMRKCSICHTLEGTGESGGARRAGPGLGGLFGRRAGTVPGYRYSATLDGSAIIWSPETISALFELGPDHYIPGSKMPMQKIVSAADRADLIAYLRQATAGSSP